MKPTIVAMPWGEKRLIMNENDLDNACIEQLMYDGMIARQIYESWFKKPFSISFEVEKLDEKRINNYFNFT